MATSRDLYIDQGTDYNVIISVKNSDGTPINLSNYNVKSQMSKSHYSNTVYDLNAAIYDAVLGSISLGLTSTQSDLIPSGRFVYDVEITQTQTGIKKRIIEGIITITPQVTKS